MRAALPVLLMFACATALHAQTPPPAPVDPAAAEAAVPVAAPDAVPAAPADLTDAETVPAEAPAPADAAAAQEVGTRSWWWIVAAVVVGGLILAVLL
jgi:uncharacterized membrane protein